MAPPYLLHTPLCLLPNPQFDHHFLVQEKIKAAEGRWSSTLLEENFFLYKQDEYTRGYVMCHRVLFARRRCL